MTLEPLEELANKKVFDIPVNNTYLSPFQVINIAVAYMLFCTPDHKNKRVTVTYCFAVIF